MSDRTVPDVAGRDVLERTDLANAGYWGAVSRKRRGLTRTEQLDRLAESLVPDYPATDEAWADAPVLDPANPKDRIGDTKPPLHLVPAALGIYASQAMANGAAKYGPYNWREKKVKAHVYLAAALRHLHAWFDGEDVAEDSGVHHLAHAAAGLAILLDAMATGNLIDDRPVAGAAGRLIAEFTETRAA